MDWDKLRIFHAAAQAGSFTHAGDALGMSQSAVSRQVSGLEQELGVPLFHRHARGLILTEQGDVLFRTARDVLTKLESVKTQLADSRDKPTGLLKITTTVGIGSAWLTRRINDFIEKYPGIRVQIILKDDELDLAMREADVAIRLRQPVQPDLVQRRMFTVHMHLYASPTYVKRFGEPRSLAELDEHRIISFGVPVPTQIKDVNWLEVAGREPGNPRQPALRITNLGAIRTAVQLGAGIAVLPDYMMEDEPGLVKVLPDAQVPSFDTYFVYPAELRNSARVNVFRDFLLNKAQDWSF